MPALNRNEKVKCEECGQEYRRADNARHRKRCAKGFVSCSECKYSTYNQQEMSYHMAKKHAQPSSKQSTVCSSCEQEFPSYYSLQQHRRKEHGAKQRKPSATVADLNKIVEDEGEDGEKLKEEFGACQHFLVDTEMENGRHKVFNFQMSKLDTKIINSGRYDLNLIKSYLIPYLIRDKEQETSVIKKANDFISFKFGDVQFLDIMKFLGGATTLDSFLKAYKASETKGFFPYEWFDNPDKLDFPGLPPYEAFFSKLRNNNPLDKDFTDYEKLRKSGLDEQQALKKLQIKTVPSSGLDNYNYLQETWKKNGMTVFKDFLKWYNNKDVVPTLEAMQKMIQFYHNKGIDMLKLGCTLPNLANICLHKSTNYKFYPFCESDKDLCEKIREDITGGPSIVFTRKAVVDETFTRDSSNICKSIVGIDASPALPLFNVSRYANRTVYEMGV